jgi:hypothetical protein
VKVFFLKGEKRKETEHGKRLENIIESIKPILWVVL